jgi:AraC-like DNA-binding protein
MKTELDVSITTIFLVGLFVCGLMLWKKRKEINDRSRTFLSLFNFFFAFGSLIHLFVLIYYKYDVFRGEILLSPLVSILGLWGITMYMVYPIEVMRPNGLRGKWFIFLFLPAFIVTLPLAFGLEFRQLYSWSDFAEHWTEFNVIIRLVAVFFLLIISLLLLIVPYNWRNSSADIKWVHRTTIMAQVISILFIGNVLTNIPVILYLHFFWGLFVMVYFTYFELSERIMPPVQDTSDTIQADINDTVFNSNEKDLWSNINTIMGKYEAWRNPDTSVETLSRNVGTNRIYVADSIREHTGLTFNDYLNQIRTQYMAEQLRKNPQQDQKSLYFDAGFRSRQTAYRNFVKFIGCSPTDYVASLA